MTQQTPWYMRQGVKIPDHVMPGSPRRETAQEFYSRVIELGQFARAEYLKECRLGARYFDQAVIDDLDQNIAVCEAELAKFR